MDPNFVVGQENLDRLLEQRMALYDIVQIMGDEVQGMKVRGHLKCHA